MSDATRCDLVAAALTRMGYTASGEHTGGGIFCVFIDDPRFPGERWIFGMANEYWSGHRITDDGAAVNGTGLDLGIPSDAAEYGDMRQVAEQIDYYLRNIDGPDSFPSERRAWRRGDPTTDMVMTALASQPTAEDLDAGEGRGVIVSVAIAALVLALAGLYWWAL